jgi:hypothetical protein
MNMKPDMDGMPDDISVLLGGTFSDFPGVHVFVREGDASDYLAMRGAQLAALICLVAMEGFESQSIETKTNVRWLASTLANEVNHMIPIALREASRVG